MATDEKWRRVAWDLFGYKLATERNVDEIAGAMARIWDLLDDNRDPQISVRERIEDADIIEGEAGAPIRLPAP